MKKTLIFLLLTLMLLSIAIGFSACGNSEAPPAEDDVITDEYYCSFDGDDGKTKVSLGDKITLPTTVDMEEGYELLGWEIGGKTYEPGETITLSSGMFYQRGNENGVNIFELDCRPITDVVRREVVLHYFGDKTLRLDEGNSITTSESSDMNAFCLNNADMPWKEGNHIDFDWLFLDKYDFEGWYIDKEYTKEFWNYSDLDTKNSGNEVHLYAKWTYTGIVYEEYDATRWYVAEIDLSKDIEKLVIPSVYGRGKKCTLSHIGYEIISISKDAFKGEGTIGTLVLKEGIELSDENFAEASIDCISLDKVALPDQYTNIFDGYNGVLSCSAGSSYEFLDGVLYSKTSNEIIWVSKHLPTEITLRNGVTEIRNYFAGTNIKQITLPDTVQAIGDGAFKNCAELTKVLANGLENVSNTAFEGCPLFEYEIYNGGKYIGNSLLGIVEGTTSLEIKEGCISIPNGILENNGTVKTVVLPSTVATIGNEAFKNSAIEEITVLGTNVYFGYNAFENCLNLKTVNMPESTRFIGSNCFSNCVSLVSIDLSGLFNDEPDVIVLDSSAFAGCTSLETVIMSENIKLISDACFANCSALKEIVLPANIVELGISCFKGCYMLKTVTMPGVERLGVDCFYDCAALTSIELPKLTAVPENCFAYCVSLSSVSIPAVESLEANCFECCESLSNLILPNTVLRIGSSCFNGCSNLKYIFYCDSYDKWTSIENECYEIEEIVCCYSETAQTVENYIETKKLLWSYDDNGAPELWIVETDLLNGKTFALSDVSVTVSDYYWDLIVLVKEAGQLESAFGSDPDLYNAVSSANTREELNEALAEYYLNKFASHKLSFENGHIIGYQYGEAASNYSYIEINGEMTYTPENGNSYYILSDSQIYEQSEGAKISNNDTMTITLYYTVVA